MLAGFERVKRRRGVPSVTFAENRITFNRAAVEAIGAPLFAEISLNPAAKQLAIEAAEKESAGAIRFAKTGRFAAYGSRSCNTEAAEKVRSLMKWDLSRLTYRAAGHVCSDGKVVVFDLGDAAAKVRRKTKTEGL